MIHTHDCGSLSPLAVCWPSKNAGDFLQIQEDNGVRETSSHMDIAESRSLQVFLSDAKASPYDRDEGGEGKGKGERGMVLYNVSPGTKLHARLEDYIAVGEASNRHGCCPSVAGEFGNSRAFCCGSPLELHSSCLAHACFHNLVFYLL